MIPSTVVGVILFGVLLAPGFVALERHERFHAAEDRSGLREAALAVRTSVGSSLFVLLAFGILRSIVPTSTPDIGALVREPGDAFARDYLSISLWGLAALVLASCVAWVWVVPPLRAIAVTRNFPVAGDWFADSLRKRRGTPIARVSGWTEVFAQANALDGPTDAWALVTLNSGDVLKGLYLSHDPNLMSRVIETSC